MSLYNPRVQKILLRNVKLYGIDEELFIEQSFSSHMSSEIKVWSRKFYISYALCFINRVLTLICNMTCEIEKEKTGSFNKKERGEEYFVGELWEIQRNRWSL